ASQSVSMPDYRLWRCRSEPLISDRGSRCDHEEDSDRLSVDSALREPLKFRAPHSFVRFGIGGKVLVVDPSQSVSVVEIRDLKALVDDGETRRIVEAAESFKD
uniref:FERM domain-containing protein n=1 Tax=Parascaris univalens TaxID=6257 RepID=A0A914ZJM0_PARUN